MTAVYDVSDDAGVGRPPGRPRPSRRPAVGRLLRRLVALTVLAALAWLASVPLRVWWVARADERPRSDAIVVLGASQFDGRPSEIFRARLEHAVALFEDGVAPRIITVGGNQPGDRFTEAGAGRRYLVSHGVPAGQVLAVEQGSNTLTSLAAVGDLLERRGWRSAVLVSDPWHAFRSREMAEDVGMAVATSPARSGPVVQSRDTEVRYIVRESLAYLHYRFTGRSNDSGAVAPAAARPLQVTAA